MSKIIKFEDVKERAAKEAYYETCDVLYDELVNVLCNVEAGDNQLAGVTISALLDVLRAGGLDKKTAKFIIARALLIL